MSKLIEAYTGLLNEVGLTVRDDGTVLKKDNAYFVKGKPLVLPLASVLRSDTVQDKIVFHPLLESVAKGESDVLEDLRFQLTKKISMNTARLAGFLLMLATGELKISLSPEQLKVMGVLKGIDEKISTDIMQIIEATTRGEGKRTPLVKIYLNRKPTMVGKVKYNRNGVVTFPLYEAAKEELKSRDKGYKLLGISTNKKTLEALIRLFEYIFPGIGEQEDCYNVGSANQIAPYADALFRTAGGLYAAINESIKLFKDTAPIVEKIIMEDSWLDLVADIDALYDEINRIPLQPNADGKSRVVDIEKQETAAPQQQVQQPGGVQVSQPSAMNQYANQPAPVVPVATDSTEPEYIIRADGKRARNPKFVRQLTVGVGMGMGGSPYDPYNSQVAMPTGARTMTQDQMIATQAGSYVTSPQQSTVYVPYGSQQQQQGYVYGAPNYQGTGQIPGL